jgi:hypothetical protein
VPGTILHVELKRKIEDLEKKYDHQFAIVFEAIKKLIEPPPKPKRRIGFILEKQLEKTGD